MALSLAARLRARSLRVPRTPWEETLKKVSSGDTAGLLAFLATLDEPGRRAIAAELPGYVSGAARAASWWEWPRQGRPLLMAGVACMGGAAAVTSWLFRRELPRWLDEKDVGLLLDLLRRRPVEWQADVARRLAARMRLPDPRHWEVAATLVRETGIEPPDSEAFMIGWLSRLSPETAGHDPLLAAYGPRIFDLDGLAQAPLRQVVETVARLVHDGLLDRAAVIDALVRRLLRDGPAARAELASLHDRLDLDIDESASRARDYTGLLPAGPVAVADLALAQLRRLEEAGRLGEELFAEAMRSLAFRPEKKLLRAAVSWAGDAALREAGRADTVLETLATIFTQDTLALQERAVRLAVRLAPQAGPDGREAIRQAAAELPESLREQISAAYGGGIAEAALPAAPSLSPGAGPRLPPPIGSPEELVQELVAFRWPPDAVTFERLLAGLAEWSHREPERLRTALRPWWHPFTPAAYGHNGREVHESLFTAVSAAFLAFAAPEHSRRLTARAAKRRRPASPAPLELLYRRRAMELVTPFEQGTGYPVLLATPTAGTGRLDPATLLDRLERLEAAGIEALPADLAQALLRLPRRFTSADVVRAAALTSQAGRTCAAWMRDGGLPDPGTTVTVLRTSHHAQLETVLGPPAPHLPEEIRALFEIRDGYPSAMTWWPLALPSHREFGAAHLVGHLPNALDLPDSAARALPALAHGDGPPGTAVAHALVCGMGHAKPAERVAATDAFLTLAARDELPAEALAQAVTVLVTADVVKLNRVVSVLDEATQAGAHEAVWAVIAGVLASLLPKEDERPRAGVADLLATGARAARIAGARAELPEVAAVAGRRGSSRLVMEARRLTHLVGDTARPAANAP